VIEVPDDALGATNIGVWGSTWYRSGGSWNKGDQMGRPAINTVFNSGEDKNAFNRGRFNNKKVDELLESGARELDQNKRKAIYSEYQKIIVDEVPVIFVYSNLYTDVVSKKVKGGIRNFPGSGPTDLHKWWIEEKAQ